MHRNLFIVFALIFLSTILAAPADQEGPYTYTVTNGNATITGFDTAYSGALVITNTLGGFPVTSMGSYAFLSCTGLTSVTIPNSVISIGYEAFYNCTSLTSVTIPNSVTDIGPWAFNYCTSLTSVTIPNNVTNIGYEAFSYCTSLASVTIPNSLTFIDSGAFYNCTSLTGVTIPNSVTNIGLGAFSHCTSLTSVTIPNSVTSIGLSAFYGCTSLTSVTIPNSVTSIGSYTFYSCNSLTSVTIPNSVIYIGKQAFDGCTSLTAITVDPANTAYSSQEGVLLNKSLTTLVQCPGGKTGAYSIPDSVTSIGNYAFRNCTSLASVTIPAGVTFIGSSAFRNCTSLQRVYFAGDAPTPESAVFSSTPATVYYLPNTTGWGSTYADRPAALWNPTFTAMAFGVGQVSCTVTGTPAIPISVDATTNLLTGPWLRLHTTNLTADSLDFIDPDSTNYPARFYRISGP